MEIGKYLPKLKPKRGNLVINEAFARFCFTRDSWFNKKKYIRLAVPWDRVWGSDYLTKVSAAQDQAIYNFAKAASATKGMDRWSRRGAIATALKGKTYGGKPKPAKGRKVSVEEAYAAIKAAGV